MRMPALIVLTMTLCQCSVGAADWRQLERDRKIEETHDKVEETNKLLKQMEFDQQMRDVAASPACDPNPLHSGKCWMIKRKDFPKLPAIKNEDGSLVQEMFVCPASWKAASGKRVTLDFVETKKVDDVRNRPSARSSLNLP